MPKDPLREEAVEFAKTRTVEERLTHVLVWSRKEEIWCYPEGTTLVKTMDVGEALDRSRDCQGAATEVSFSAEHPTSLCDSAASVG